MNCTDLRLVTAPGAQHAPELAPGLDLPAASALSSVETKLVTTVGL